jgi:ferredoxin
MSRIHLAAPDRPAADFEASPVYSVLVAAQRNGVPLRHDCGGKAQCGTCRVKVISGKLSPMAERERVRLEAVGALPGRNAGDGSVAVAGADRAGGLGCAIGAGPVYRLACQSRPGSDLELEAVLPLERKPDNGKTTEEGR